MASVNVTRNQQAAISKIPLSRFLAGEDLLCEGGLPEGGPTTVRWWIETDDPVDCYTTARVRIQELDGRAIAYGRILERTTGLVAPTTDAIRGGYGSFGAFACQGYVRARLGLGDSGLLGNSPNSESSNICMTVMPGSPAEFEWNTVISVAISDTDTAFDQSNGWLLPPRGTTRIRSWLVNPTAPLLPPIQMLPCWGVAGFGIAAPFPTLDGEAVYTHGYVAPCTDAQLAPYIAALAVPGSSVLSFYMRFTGKW